MFSYCSTFLDSRSFQKRHQLCRELEEESFSAAVDVRVRAGLKQHANVCVCVRAQVRRGAVARLAAGTRLGGERQLPAHNALRLRDPPPGQREPLLCAVYGEETRWSY